MVGASTPSHWLHWNGPWSRTLTLAPGTFISRTLRLVRPVLDTGVQNTWVADHLALQREVSVTFHVPRSSAASLTAAADAERLLSESSALSHVRLSEPHFVHVIEQGTSSGGVPFIVTELLEGSSLRHRLVHGNQLSLDEAEHVVRQAAGALAQAHAARVAHGNIRPEMMFLSEVLGKPFLKILGFGASFDSDGPNEPDASRQAYTSPEQLLLATGPDAQGDLWALAVSLYELLTTTLPFEAPTSAGVTVAICNAQFSPPSHYRADLPPAVDAWFARALSKSVADRFRDAAELARAFALATSGANVPGQAVPRQAMLPSPVLPHGVPSHGMPSHGMPSHVVPAHAVPPYPGASQSSLAPSTRVGDEQDEDEMTVRWDVPGEWPPTPSGRTSAELPARPLPGDPPPLPNRMPSSRPPPSLDSTAATGFSHSPPTSAAVPRTSYLAAVASALAVPRAVPAVALPPSSSSMAPPLTRAAQAVAQAMPPAMAQAGGPHAGGASSRAVDRRLILAASVFSVLVVASAWLYSSSGSPSSASPRAAKGTPSLDSASDSTPIVAMTVRAEDLPEVGSEDDPAVASQRELPEIIHTQDLPPAPEEGSEEVPGDVLPAGVSPAVSPGVSRPLARAVAETAPRSARPAGKASCNPPYYFDANNIRRLKLECLGGSAEGAAPVQKKHALTPAAAAPPRNKPVAGNQAQRGASCTPPYYFDRNNIRRLKLECL